MIEKWTCNRCHWAGDFDEIHTEVVFPGSQEEPPEHANYCPDCGMGDALETYHGSFCRVCEDVSVEDDGDMCAESITSHGVLVCASQRGH